MPSNIDIVALPSLSSNGWVFSSLKQADFIMAHFLASQKSQSYVFGKDISSFAYLVSCYCNDPETLAIETKNTLEKILNRYFNGVDVQTYSKTQSNSETRYELHIYGEFRTSDNTLFKLTEVVQINGSVFQRINDAILNGT